MNPFDQPPVGAAVSFEPPEPPSSGPRRGRMALVALLTAGLIGGGIAGISQLASADRPDLAVASIDEPSEGSGDETPPPADDGDDAPAPEPTDEPEVPAPSVEADGEITLDTGDGDPIVIDLGDIADGDVGRLTECLGFPMFDFDIDVGTWEPGDGFPEGFPSGDLEDFFDDLPFDVEQFENWDPGEFGDLGDLGDLGGFDLDGSVTVTGPDGVSVIDLGEDGSVTITKNDGEISISTEGDATVSDLAELFGDFGTIFEGGLDIDQGAIDEFLESLPNFDERDLPVLDGLPDFRPLDPDAVQRCLDEVVGN